MSSKGTKKRKTWRCDVCQIAVFDTYDEALDHEQSCQGNTEADIDALASAVARGTASGAITNSGVEEEEEEEERGIGEAVFLAVSGGTVKNNNNGSLLLKNGEGASPTVSTPTVLALLASRAATGSGVDGGNNMNNNGGAAVNPEIALPNVSTAGAVAVTATSNAATNSTHQQQQQPTCTVIAKEHQNEEPEHSAAPINIEETPQPSPPPLNTATNNNTNTPPPKRPRSKWRCDYCPAIFNEYDEAIIHETHCKKNKTAIILNNNTPNNNIINTNNNGNTNTTTPSEARPITTPNGSKFPWKCDYCPALFRSYDDALVHENECKSNRRQKSSISSGGGVKQIGVPSTICIPTKVGLNETTTTEDDILAENKIVVAAAASSPLPPTTPSNINSNQKRLNWKCDVCLVAVFESYEEALAHENQCKGGGELGRDMKKAKALEKGTMDNDVEQQERREGEKEVDVVKDVEVGENEVVQQQQQLKVIQQQLPDRMVPQQQQQLQQEQLPKFQRSQVAQKEGETLPQKQATEDNNDKKRKQPTAKESQPGLEKKRMEVRKEREREAEKERARKARQEAAQKAKKAKEVEKQQARSKAAKEAALAAEKEKRNKATATSDASPKPHLQGGGSKNNIFLSLKDDFYRTHMFAYFRKLGALKQVQRDAEEEKRIKEEAFLFFKNSGRKLVKFHDWKRPDLGYSEVDEEYARRKVSDDIRRRLDQRNLWDILVDDESESDDDETDQSSAKSPFGNKSSAISNGTVGSELQKKKKKAPEEHPVAKEIGQRVEVQQQFTVQQPVPMQPLVQEPQMNVRVAQQPIVHQLIGPQSQLRRTQEMGPTTAQQTLVGNFLNVQQGMQHSSVALQPPMTNQIRSNQREASKTTPVNNDKIAERPAEQITARDLGIHDYIFGTSFRGHVGNRNYLELASQKTTIYQNAKAIEKAGIAASVVNEWRKLDSPGRFLKTDSEKGHFVDVGNEKAIAKTKKILRAKPATPTKSDVEVNTDSVPGRESRESSSLSPLNAAANLKRNNDDASNTNAVIASIAQLAEEELERDTDAPQATPTRKQSQTITERKRSKLRPILTVVLLLVILSIATLLSAPPHYQKRGFELLFFPALVVLTLLLSLGLTVAYASFTLTAATITSRRRRQVRLFTKVLQFLASALILVSVSLYLQSEPVMTVLLGMSSSMWKRFGVPGAALLALCPLLLFLSFSMAMFVTHEGPHHHIEGGFFQEAFNLVEDTCFGPPIPSTAEEEFSLPTLRDYLLYPEGFHMAFAPAFFGFFAYFGCLSALEEGTGGLIVPPNTEKRNGIEDEYTSLGLRSVAGASAGAMAATLLASGIDPSVAAEFTSKFTWGMVSDPPGIGGYVKGNRFEQAMVDFLLKEASKVKRADKSSDAPMQFDEALIPCAVSGFDLLRMKGVILSSGSMAKAARASAGFPGLFQPVAWRENCDKEKWLPDALLIDGGIRDGLGLAGLSAFGSEKKRVVNVVVGDFGFSGASGIHSLPEGVNASSLVSISIAGTPVCGPWAMENGKRAVESAKKAMLMALDQPMEKGDGENHYVLRLDASKFLD